MSAATSAVWRHDVVPAMGFTITALGGSSVEVRWVQDEYKHRVWRWVNGAWANQGTVLAWSGVYVQPSPQPGVPYNYKVEKLDGQTVVATSNVDLAMRTSFTGDPLAGSVVRAQHVTQLVTTTNTLRAAAGLAPIALNGASAGQPILAAHITTLRTAVNEARTALGVPAMAFTDTLTAPARVKAVHVQQLRDAFR